MRCQSFICIQSATHKDSIAFAKSNGWSVDDEGQKFFCPGCVGRYLGGPAPKLLREVADFNKALADVQEQMKAPESEPFAELPSDEARMLIEQINRDFSTAVAALDDEIAALKNLRLVRLDLVRKRCKHTAAYFCEHCTNCGKCAVCKAENPKRMGAKA